jgi:hypothetical protein
MRPLIRNVFTFIFLCLTSFKIYAGNEIALPVKAATFHLIQIEKLDSFLRSTVTVISVQKVSEKANDDLESSKSGSHICSCQVLNLESSNYDHRYVVLLAEKTNNGSSSDYKEAKNRLLKEKKHLKQMFYDKIKVVAEIQGTGSCKSMFYKLRTADSHLQLYEILNADTF